MYKKTSLFAALVFIIFFAVLFTNCSKHAVKQKPQISYQEARLYDIPLMMGARPIPEVNHVEADDNSFYAYACNNTRHEIDLYYQDEMEFFGWRALSHIKTFRESLLLFEKPSKIACISIRSNNKEQYSNVYIFIGLKDSSEV